MKRFRNLLVLTATAFAVLFAFRALKHKKHVSRDGNVPPAHVHRVALKPSQVDKSKTRIVIHKAAYELELYEADSLLRTYPVVFGFNPTEDKMMQGDGCTPEGKFKLRAVYDHAKWSKFMWVDYPNEESRKKFKQRKAQKKIPENATIGGEIGIHGVPEGYDHAISEKQNWTLGCISLTTSDVIELYSLVQEGTEVAIYHE